MIIDAIGLGSVGTNKATGRTGTITQIRTDARGEPRWYAITVKGLDPETKQAKLPKWSDASLVVPAKPDSVVPYELPDGVLGNKAVDKITGYSGMVVGFVLHHHGCIHVVLQSDAVLKNGNDVDWHEANVLDCQGKGFERFKKMTDAEVRVLEKVKPSPSFAPRFKPF